MRLSAYVFLFEHCTKKTCSCPVHWEQEKHEINIKDQNFKSTKHTLELIVFDNWFLFSSLSVRSYMYVSEPQTGCTTYFCTLPPSDNKHSPQADGQSGLLSRCPRSSIKRLSLHYTRLQIQTRQQGKHSCFISLTSAA